MLSLRSTSGSSNSNVNNNNSTNLQTSSFMNGSHLTSNSTSSGNGTGTGGSNPSSPSKAASSSSHGGHHQHHHQQPTYIPTSAMIPAPLPGPSEEFYSTNFQEQQIPKHHQQHKDGQQQSHIRTLTAVSNPTIRPGVPQAKRPPHDPSSAPGVSFRSSLKPHSDASIPDIPYGSGQGRDQGKKRSVSISSNQPTSITNNTNTTTTSSTGGKARTFTPSDAHKGIRVLPQEAEKKNLHDNTSNNASNKPEHTTTIIASSSPAPSTQLFTPSAPLTVNAPVVPAGPQLVTNVNTTALEKNLTDNQAGSSAAAGKQPTKSALKQPQARSWADLVRPMNNIKLAEHTVKNIGLPEDMQNKDPAADAAMASFVASPEKKKRVSIAVPVASPSATASLADTNSATNAHDTTGADSAADTGADTISSEATAASTTAPAPAQPSVTSATDKSLKAAAGAGNGDHKHRKHDSSSRSTHSVNDARSIKSSTSTGTHGSVLDSYVSKKTRLEDILQGVENSSSSVLLYPRGLVNTGNACFMNAILQSLLFTGPFYNLISLIGANTSQDLSGKTPLLDAMVSYLSEFRATKDHSMQDQENHIHRGEAYEEPPSSHSSEAFIPSIIYHALNHNRRFAQMGFYNPTSSASSSLSNGSHKVGNAPITTSQINSNNRLSQEDAHEFLGFFLDTIHEELLIKIEQHDSLLWQKASKGAKAGQDIFSRESVNSIAAMNQSSPAHAQSQQNGDEDWLEVGTKGRTATTRTTEQQESAVTRIFGGQLRSVLRCPGSKDSVTLEPFTSLQLEIHVRSHALHFSAYAYDTTNMHNIFCCSITALLVSKMPSR